MCQPFFGSVGYLLGAILIIQGQHHDPPSGVVLAPFKQYVYVRKIDIKNIGLTFLYVVFSFRLSESCDKD